MPAKLASELGNQLFPVCLGFPWSEHQKSQVPGTPLLPGKPRQSCCSPASVCTIGLVAVTWPHLIEIGLKTSLMFEQQKVYIQVNFTAMGHMLETMKDIF